jgi:HEAT repeat protein
LRIATGRPASASGAALPESPAKDDAVRSTAVLLLAERGDPNFVPAILALLAGASEALRGDALRALGFFHDARANQALFERLHSPATNDRINAILGLRNLQSKDAIPALIAMLNDPEAPARQVANFALQNLTGQSLALSATAPAAESSRLQAQWRGWWRERSATFKPLPQSPCRDW